MSYRITNICDQNEEVQKINIGDGKVYYVEKDAEPYLQVEVDSSMNPFDQALIYGKYLCLGVGERVYFLDLEKAEYISIDVDCYFGYFYKHNQLLYITSASEVLVFDNDIHLLWKSEKLAIDGVVIKEFSEDCIYLSCEMDPPGGWIERKLDLRTGREVL